MNAYFDAMRRYATFGGRSTRAQYWLFTLILFLFSCVAFALDAAVGNVDEGALFVTGIVYFAHFIPMLAVTVRRLHDTDRSGWWMLIAFVPFVGQIVMLIFLCTPSTAGANRFGGEAGKGPLTAAYTPTSERSAPSGLTHLDKLEKLASLRSSGAIDDGEFETMKADLLKATPN